jgi:RNA polymerase sigma-70 factor (ECF subfamily)
MDRTWTGEGTEGVEATFCRLFESHQGEIAAYLARLVGDPALAEDLSQDTFEKALRALGRLPAEANVRAWLYRIATNTALDCLRRRKLITWLPLLDRDKDPTARSSFAEASLESVAVRRALDRMPPRYRVPLVLYACQGLSTREIALVLRLSPSGVKTRLYRAREKFRHIYAPEEVEG